MKSVIDTSTLISLARISYLEIIPRLKIDAILPDDVYEEAVINGEKRGIADATVIKSFIANYKIKVVHTERNQIEVVRQKLNKILAKGDEAVLSLAIKEEAKVVITNDDGLGKIAMALGFRVNGSPDMLMKGLREKVLDFREFESLIRGLVIENRLSPVIAELYLLEGKKYVED